MRRLIKELKRIYHFLWAIASALWYGWPSRKIAVVAVTGTKGKTTTVELISAVLEAAGYRTAISSTLRFKIGSETQPNLFKMTMPGRAFLQKFLRQAVRASCDYAIVEMTSEGAAQFRHRFIELNALIFINLAPEHLEAHGSLEKYLAAKLSIAEQLKRSKKTDKVLVVNADDPAAEKFLAAASGVKQIAYSLKRPAPEVNATPLQGEFNHYNVAAAVAFAKSQNVASETIVRAIKQFKGVRGRLEEVISKPFKVIVDYAHTPDSLRAVYTTLRENPKSPPAPTRPTVPVGNGRGLRRAGEIRNPKLICVLGSCGGGRDKWKRPVMGRIAGAYCHSIILTDEDPYDEDPRQIVEEIARAIPQEKCQVVMDRREAIQEALRLGSKLAQSSDNNVTVIITGKGTDPCICGPRGIKIPWDDAAVVREEFSKLRS